MRETVKKTKLTENCSKQTIQLFVEELIPKLSVEEKVGIMSGQVTEQKLLDDLFLIEHYNIKPYPTMAVERLGIPNVRFVDGPRGVVAGTATCFPVSMARGATFDPELEKRSAELLVQKSGTGWKLLWRCMYQPAKKSKMGRAQECYGEDPYHMGEMGAALTRGVQSQNVMACIKHFAMNSIENARFKADVYADKRTLHEVYLPHFKRVSRKARLPSWVLITKYMGNRPQKVNYCFGIY